MSERAGDRRLAGRGQGATRSADAVDGAGKARGVDSVGSSGVGAGAEGAAGSGVAGRGGAGAGVRSARKRGQILAAGRELFLEHGYLGTNVDEIAARSQVSKPTVYSHFGSKKGLFVEIVSAMTGAAGDRVLTEAPGTDVASYLHAHFTRQLRIVLDPELLRLRRLVIGEVGRFPELAEALYTGGPARAIAELARTIAGYAAAGQLSVEDPAQAADFLNWLVMGRPINDAMLLGDEGIMPVEEHDAHVAEAVRIFLAAHRPD